MTPLSDLIQQGSGNWPLFILSALLLGALHGLEPGHSKTVMAAFIITVHGTVKQAVLLGLSATLSHTLVVWLVALAGLSLGSHWNAETSEPYFQIVSGILIMVLGFWMMGRIWRSNKCDHHHHYHDDEMDDGMDAHARAHAKDIKKRFANRKVTTGQIIMFGLTGGLLPCPAAVTVLLLCLQLKQISLGIGLVVCFSIGLAVTLVTVGTAAALASHHVSKRLPVLERVAHYAPYFSGLIILLIGLYVGLQGYNGLTAAL